MKALAKDQYKYFELSVKAALMNNPKLTDRLITSSEAQKHPGAEVLFPHSKVYPQLHPALPLCLCCCPLFYCFLCVPRIMIKDKVIVNGASLIAQLQKQ